MTEAGADSPESRVREAVRQGLGDSGLRVEGERLLAGGAMHASWAADALQPAGKAELVVRMSPPNRDDSAVARREFALLQTMHKRGLPVPRPIYVGENEHGQTFMLMDRLPGDSNPRQLLTGPKFAAAREAIIGQLASALARIHQVLPADVPAELRQPAPGQDPLFFELDRLEADYRAATLNPHPVVEWALRWSRRHAEALPHRDRPPHVVHGDFRVGNLMYDASGLTGILDWEGSSVNEAEADLSWFCTKVWRFGQYARPAGGLVSREEWLAAYEAAGGFPVDRERFRIWEVLMNIRWAVVTLNQARSHIDGVVPSHELAAIGRRTADTELEILRLIDPEGARHAG